MKILLIAASMLFLAGCDGPLPLSEAEGITMKACLDKGWIGEFNATSGRRKITCKRK